MEDREKRPYEVVPPKDRDSVVYDTTIGSIYTPTFQTTAEYPIHSETVKRYEPNKPWPTETEEVFDITRSQLNKESLTPLQLHCMFFDRDMDGFIYPWDTFVSLRSMGMNLLVSAFTTLLIHLVASYPTQETWIPDPFFVINIKNVHKAKHGSDSQIYDQQGNFHAEKFDEMCAKFRDDDLLGVWDLFEITESFRVAYDFFGWIVSKFEFGILLLLLGGSVTKRDLRKMYDGSLFYDLEQRNK